MKVASIDRAALASALDAAGADGWLLYDFQGVNPVLAQVSAAAVASAPDTTQSAAGVPASNAAPDAAAPPLASTCQASRRSPLASSAAGRRRGANRETALERAKNASNTAPPGQPVPARTAVPTSQAAAVPTPSSARAAKPPADTSAETSIATPMLGGDIGGMSAVTVGGRKPDPARLAPAD